MNPKPRRASRVATGATGAVIAAMLLTACASNSDAGDTTVASTTAAHSTSHAVNADKQLAIHSALRQLWGQHMEWTFATVNAFFHDQKALTPTLNRLLANQKDIGDAVAAYYGQEAGDQLTELLTTHIQEAVPVLQAAQAGDEAKLAKAQADWYANAKEIADFLSEANPDNWPPSATEPMLKTHITQTTAYSVDLLKGDYAAAIKAYDEAEEHMLMLGDVLADGLIAQFPQKFA